MNNQPPKFHDLEILRVTQETAESVVITFLVPPPLTSRYAFTPGQYLTLRTSIDGQDVRRSYSICSPAGTTELSVGIKSVKGGLFSNFAQQLTPGTRLSVMTPQGRFTAYLGGTHDYLLIAAGSGITPMVSIAESVLAGEPHSTVTLLYANRNTRSVMFRQHLDDLKDRYMTRFLLTHVMDEESQDVELLNGRLDAAKLHNLTTCGLINTGHYSATYVCGPEPMINEVTETLEKMGIEPASIKKELFTPSAPTRRVDQINPLPDIPTDDKPMASINVLIDGTTRSFTMKLSETLLTAAARSGLDIPYSCANGMCATCRCKLTAGTADMAQNFSLDPWEIDAGFVLACQLQPTSENIALDFDAV